MQIFQFTRIPFYDHVWMMQMQKTNILINFVSLSAFPHNTSTFEVLLILFLLFLSLSLSLSLYLFLSLSFFLFLYFTDCFILCLYGNKLYMFGQYILKLELETNLDSCVVMVAGCMHMYRQLHTTSSYTLAYI